jgi:hypothetical protein
MKVWAPGRVNLIERAGRGGGRLYPLRGRVRCSLCGRRTEGSHQKGSNWYRCQFVYKRGIAAADAAGHPRVLGIREELILEPLLDFLGRRLFGPDRLRLLHDELAISLDAVDDDHATELAAVKRQLGEIDQAVRRQALRLEEHDDPDHPVVAAAKARIEELAAQRGWLDEQRHRLESRRSDAPQPHEIEALLTSIPDLRPALARYGSAELADLFDAFDVTITYDKPSHALELAATVTDELVPAPETLQPPRRRSQGSDIAGAGCGHISPISLRTASPRYGRWNPHKSSLKNRSSACRTPRRAPAAAPTYTKNLTVPPGLKLGCGRERPLGGGGLASPAPRFVR